MRLLFVTIVLIVCSLRLPAQDNPGQGNKMIFYPVNDPVLQQYNIRHASADHNGKLWLSTSNGLLCYDGNDVKVFKHDDNDPSSLSSDNISKTYPDSKGNLYIINDLHEKERSLSFMDGKTGKFTPLVIQIKGNDTRMMATPFAYSDLFIDDDGSIWLAAYYVGFIHYDSAKARTDTYYLNEEYSGKNTIYTIKKDYNNKQLLWLGTENGIYSFNKETKKLTRNFRCSNPGDSSNADLRITNIDIYNPDSIWFSASGKGLGCYDIKTGYYKIYPGINSKEEKDNKDLGAIQIQRKSKNEYYVATKYSLPGVFNTYTHQYKSTTITSQNLPSGRVDYFLADSAGNSWCILYNRLFRAHATQDKFATIQINIDRNNKGVENAFKNIVWSEKERLYYAAFQKSRSVFVLDTSFRIKKTIPVIYKREEMQGAPEISDLALDKNGRLWICGSTLFIYDKTRQKIVPSSEIYPRLIFKDLQFQNLVIRGDNIYLQPLTYASRAIYRININSLTLDSIIFPDEISKDKIYEYQPVKLLDYLAIDKEGENAYFGYSKYSFLGYNDCLIQFNLTTKKAKRVKLIDGVEHNESSALFKYAVDDNDRIWVETLNGMAICEPRVLHENENVKTEAEPYSIEMRNIAGAGIMCRLYSKGIMLYDYRKNKQIHLTLNDGLTSYLNSTITCVNDYLFVGASDYIQYIPLAAATGRQVIRKCYLSSILLFNKPYQTDTLPQNLQQLTMPHDKNFITLTFSSAEFEQPERLEYRYKMDGIDKGWVYVNYLNRTISYNNLKPGNYTFHAAVKNDDGKWSRETVDLTIHIIPAWWQTAWFKILLTLAAGIIIYLFVLWRIKSVRKQEQLKGSYEKELLELEAKALRAQMNPHFIFNCMNSIKSLIQENEKNKAVIYLTTFSKLIRTVFQNSDKREITLHDEIETCRLYTQLESMRFGNKFTYTFNVDESLDTKSIMIPALIIQPFIENAIWHGIMPKEESGTLAISVERVNSVLRCVIDDNGIGRDTSKQNKFKGAPSTHQSRGVHLTQARLNLHNLMNERNGNMEIIDKKNENGKASGTTVILTFNEY